MRRAYPQNFSKKPSFDFRNREWYAAAEKANAYQVFDLDLENLPAKLKKIDPSDIRVLAVGLVLLLVPIVFLTLSASVGQNTGVSRDEARTRLVGGRSGFSFIDHSKGGKFTLLSVRERKYLFRPKGRLRVECSHSNRRVQGHVRGFFVADLPNHEDIRVLAHEGASVFREG